MKSLLTRLRPDDSKFWFAPELKRKLLFALIGILGALVSLGLLFVLVKVLDINKYMAGAVETVISVELNFALSHFVAWKDRSSRGVRALSIAWLKFHAVHIVTASINFGSFCLYRTQKTVSQGADS